MAETNEAEKEILKKEFQRAHRIAVINNGIVLMLGLAVITLTAKKMTP